MDFLSFIAPLLFKEGPEVVDRVSPLKACPELAEGGARGGIGVY